MENPKSPDNMSTTNNIQPVDLQKKSLHAEKSADVIQKKIRQKRVAEANRLFQESASDIKKNDREKISRQLSALVEQAEKYFSEANTLETERKLEQAREKYKKVEDIAIDYPELPEALRRIDDAIALVRALEHRAKRRTTRQDKQSALPTTPSHPGLFRGWFPLLACFSLLLLMAGAGLFYTGNLNFTLTEKDTVRQAAPLEKNEVFKAKDTVRLPANKKLEQPKSQREENDKTTSLQQQTQKYALAKEEAGKQQDNRKQAEQIATSEINKVRPPAPEKQISKSVPAVIEEDRQQKLSEQDTGSSPEERAVSFTEMQLNREESLHPVQVSSLQVKKKIGGTSSAEDELTIRQGPQLSAYIAGNHELSMPEKSAPQRQDDVVNRLTADEPEQPQQTRAVIKQQNKSPVEISSTQENSAESVYTVQPGDTLRFISMKVYGTSSKWPAIANANKDQLTNNPDGLLIGMTLAIPIFSETGNVHLSPGSSTSLPDLNEDGTYTVQSGDTLSIIAQRLFGNARKWRQIYELNNDVLTAPHTLKVGQVLRIKAFEPVIETIEPSEPEPEEERPAVPFFWSEEEQSASENIDSR